MTFANRRLEQVLAYAEEFALSRATTAAQRRLLETALWGLRQQTSEQESNPFVDVPLLVYAGLRGGDAPAVPLAAATSFVFLGADIFDDLADGDLSAHWEGWRPAEINLAAATLLCCMPQLVLAELDAAPSCRAAMQQTLAQGLLAMGAGQQRDLQFTGSTKVGADQVEESVIAKSGGEVAMFAALAAQFAGAPPPIVALYARFGQALGTAGQLASDCYDLFEAGHSRDLANGTRTAPIALHLERLTDEERPAFVELLEQARASKEAGEAVRRRLRASGDLRRCAFRVEVHCQRALQALEQARPLEPAAGSLRSLIDRISFFPKGEA